MFKCQKEVNYLKECAFTNMPFSYESWSWCNNTLNNNNKAGYYYLPLHDSKGFYQIVTNFLKYCRQVYNSLANHNDYAGERCLLCQLT